MSKIIFATELVEAYQLPTEQNSNLAYARALGACWAFLTNEQRQIILDRAKEQNADNLG